MGHESTTGPDASRRVGRLFIWSVIGAGLWSIFFSIAQVVHVPVDPRWLWLTALTLTASVATLRMKTAPASFSIGDAFTFSVLLLLGAPPATITTALEGVTMSLLLSWPRLQLRRLLFNAGAVALAMQAAGYVIVLMTGADVTTWTGRSPGQLLVPVLSAAGVYFIVNTGLVAAAVSMDERQSLLAIWRRHFLHLWVKFFGGAYTALLLTLLSPSLEMFLLVMPLPLVFYLGFRVWLGRIDDRLHYLDTNNRQYRATIDALAPSGQDVLSGARACAGRDGCRRDARARSGESPSRHRQTGDL
jgi:hypothetical protein